MLHALKIQHTKHGDQKNFISPATVTRVDANAMFKVEMTVNGRADEIWAISALSGPSLPSIGDRVLVAGETPDECYIIGIIKSAAVEADKDRTLFTRQGSSVQVVEKQGQECIVVKDANMQALFEYHPETGKGGISMPMGDLSLMAPLGNIDLISGKNIRCRSAADIEFQSSKALHMSSVGKDGKTSSQISMDSRELDLSGPKLKVSARKGDFFITDGTYTGIRLSATVERAKFVLQRLETVAVKVLQRVKNIYHHVEELSQIRAGRIRTMVKGPFRLTGKSASINTEEEVKIDGNRIHLG